MPYHRETLGDQEVIVWGHSMGSGVAAHMMALQDLTLFHKVRYG